LEPSPQSSLSEDIDPYVDWLDDYGEAQSTPDGAVLTRRWRITSLGETTPDAIAIEVCVYPFVPNGKAVGPRGASPHSHEAAMREICECGVRSGSEQRFTLIELLIAMTITLLIAGAVASVAPPSRKAFDRVPAELDLRQRGRTAIDALSQALRSSGKNVAATRRLDRSATVAHGVGIRAG
jgi:hypothetical protein